MNASPRIIKGASYIIDGETVKDTSYLVVGYSKTYRVYQRLDGKWGYVGHMAWSCKPYESDNEARDAAKAVYGF